MAKRSLNISKRKKAPKKSTKRKRRNPLTPKEQVKRLAVLIRAQINRLSLERDTLRDLLSDWEDMCDELDFAIEDADQGITLIEEAVDKISERI